MKTVRYRWPSTLYVDGHRVLNPHAPIDQWKLSPRVSKTATHYNPIAYIPENLPEAIEVLYASIALEIAPSNAPLETTSPGWVWADLHHYTGSLRGTPGCYHIGGGPPDETPAINSGCDYYLGSQWWKDGAKFKMATHHNPHKKQLLILTPEMLHDLSERPDVHRGP